MSAPRTCPQCGERPVATARDVFCHQCMPGGPFIPPPCRKCGSNDLYFSGGLCRRCHRFAPHVIDSCIDCLGWGVTRTTGWLCEGCRGWRRRFTNLGPCRSCSDEKALSGEGFCRLCFRTAVGARPHGIGPSVLEMNRHGQQLFFVGLFRQKRQRVASVPKTSPQRRTRYPVAHQQLTLVDTPRDFAKTRGTDLLPDPEFGQFLDDAVRSHAEEHGWSKTRINVTRQGLRLLAYAQATPGAPIKASEVADLDPVAFNRQPILDVLDSAGILDDDREPAIMSWYARRVADLPDAMAGEINAWFEILLRGSSTYPRSKPRAHMTIRLRVRSLLPALRAWAAEGRTSLREISRDDINHALPSQGSNRTLACTALKSLFRILKAKRLVFSNPTTHLRSGRPESRIPLPIDDSTMRAALGSGNPAREALATLIGYHALRSGQVRGLLLTDVRDGRLYLPDRTIVLAHPTRRCLTAWLDHRSRTWPESINPHFFINIQTAIRTAQVSNVWINSTLGFSAQALREDRILDEAITTKDIRRLVDLFGLSVKGAERYLRTVEQKPLALESATGHKTAEESVR